MQMLKINNLMVNNIMANNILHILQYHITMTFQDTNGNILPMEVLAPQPLEG